MNSGTYYRADGDTFIVYSLIVLIPRLLKQRSIKEEIQCCYATKAISMRGEALDREASFSPGALSAGMRPALIPAQGYSLSPSLFLSPLDPHTHTHTHSLTTLQ